MRHDLTSTGQPGRQLEFVARSERKAIKRLSGEGEGEGEREREERERERETGGDLRES